jgi:uncharacterized protein (UPF0335 family)
LDLRKLRSSESPEIRAIVKEIERLEERMEELEEELRGLVTEDGKKVLSKREWRKKENPNLSGIKKFK